MRTIVLVLCLVAAGAVAAYTQYSRGDTGEPVYTVPARAPAPAPMPSASPAIRAIDPDDHAALARALQRELKRVGCYNGEITGVWTTSSRLAMKTFLERVNASLPIDNPDTVLLSLVQGHGERACGAPCPAGQTAGAGGACVPNAILAKPAKSPADGKSEHAVASSRPEAGGTAASAMIATAPAATKPEPKAAAPGGTPGYAAEPPPSQGPVPPEGMARERRPRKSAEAPAPAPPKIVRDVLKALGF